MGRGKSLANRQLIEVAYGILEQIQPATVRAVAYALFNRKIIPSMAKAETNRVSTQLRDAREAGLVPWPWIVDETREAESVSVWDDAESYLGAVRRSYRRDRWQDQPARIEVWSEKGTVRGTLAPVLNEYGVTFRVMHGYGSATALHDIARASQQDARPITAFYVGDYDPSGLHMSEVDLPRRLERYGGNVVLIRLALAAHDVAGDRLPWFPLEDKRRDPRHDWYLPRYGRRCWELDAMNPADLRALVQAAIHVRIDWPTWQRADVVEQAETESIAELVSRWPSISRQA